MTAPSLRALGTVVKTTTATPSFAAPAGAVSTDVIAVGFFCDDGRRTITAVPTGFTLATDLPQTNDVTAGSPSHSLLVYWGRFSAVGAGPYAFTISASVFIEGRSAAIQDCVTTGNPIEAGDGNTSGNTSVTTAPAVSATSLGADRFALYAATNWTGGAWTPASGYTEQWDADDRTITLDTLTMPTAATTSPQAVCAGSNRSNAWVGIFLPVAGGSTINGTASVTGSGAVSAAAAQGAGASVAGAGSASAAALQQAVATVAGSGSVIAAASTRATASVAGAGSATAAPTTRAGSSVTGSGSVSAAVTQAATGSVAGAGSVTASAAGQVFGTASVSGVGAVTATPTLRSTATVAGVGAVSAAATIRGSASVAGAGSVTALARVQSGATVTGVGQLTASTATTIFGTASVVGVGHVTASAGSRITPRPFTGTTARPGGGTTARPFTGVTPRP